VEARVLGWVIARFHPLTRYFAKCDSLKHLSEWIITCVGKKES
jgi:hypothetical protein